MKLTSFILLCLSTASTLAWSPPRHHSWEGGIGKASPAALLKCLDEYVKAADAADHKWRKGMRWGDWSHILGIGNYATSTNNDRWCCGSHTFETGKKHAHKSRAFYLNNCYEDRTAAAHRGADWYYCVVKGWSGIGRVWLGWSPLGYEMPDNVTNGLHVLGPSVVGEWNHKDVDEHGIKPGIDLEACQR